VRIRKEIQSIKKKEIGEIDNDLKGENGTTAKIYIVGDYAEGAPKSFGDSQEPFSKGS